MTIIAGETVILDGLDQTLRSVLSGRPQTSSPRLVCVTIPTPSIDPVAMFEVAESIGDRVLWDQPTEQFSLVAAGVATEITTSGEDRIRELKASWQRLTAEAVTHNVADSPMAAPVALSGIAFRSTNDRPSAWRGYPDAVLTVPRFLFITNAASSWLVASIVVGPNDTSEPVVQSTLDELSGLLTRACSPTTNSRSSAAVVTEEDDPARWMRSVTVVQEEIRSGVIEKLVLAREIRARAEERIAWGAALRRLKERYGAGTVFAFARGERCFMGSSPERLVRLDGRTVQANCVAGSSPRSASRDADQSLGDALLRDKKELHEHTLVVDAYRDALQPCCVALDIPSQPSLLAMPNVQHLQTPVKGTLRDDSNNTHILDLVSRLHPTPAVGGVPQETAGSLIQAHEPFDRGWYAGTVGWFDSQGDGEFVVAIRSGLLGEREALLYAGCGIVEGSDPEREYAESLLKLEPMLWAMNGADG